MYLVKPISQTQSTLIDAGPERRAQATCDLVSACSAGPRVLRSASDCSLLVDLLARVFVFVRNLVVRSISLGACSKSHPQGGR